MQIRMTQDRIVGGRLMECDKTYDVAGDLGKQLCDQGFAVPEYEERAVKRTTTMRKADRTTTMVEASESKEV